MLFIYLLGFFIAVYIVLSVAIRVNMYFWHTQPVFHIYNLKYWLRPPGTINAAPPPINKFVNLSNNSLVRAASEAGANEAASEAGASHLSKICKFISDYYVIHATTTYKPSEQDIMAYLLCTNQPSFFNVYQEAPIPFVPERAIVGVTSCRVLNVVLRKKTFPVYYVDNLCIHPGYRKKGIAPEMIQSFYYTMSRTNPKVNAYLFKREGQLNAIVPLVCYDTYCFDMTYFCAEPHLHVSVVEIGATQLNLFSTFMKEHTANFECIILPDISSVLNLLKLGKIKIYGIQHQGTLTAVYVFRLLELYYDEKKAVECIAILSKHKQSKHKQSKQSTDILMAGFTMIWTKLSAETKCAIVFIEDTAHSQAVIKPLDTNPLVSRIFKSPTAFFLYNYAAYSASNKKTLLFY
jgi:hypothetical protein